MSPDWRMEGAFGNTRHERNVLYAPMFSEWALDPNNDL